MHYNRLMRLSVLSLIACAAMSMQVPSKQIITAGPTPVGPYSPAVKAGGLIYVSGSLATGFVGRDCGQR